MSTDELRQAAETLRRLVAQADRDYRPKDEQRWFRVESESIITTYWTKFAKAYPDQVPYVAAMHPGVGLALAEWLAQLAESYDMGGYADDEVQDFEPYGLRVAYLINGATS